MAEVTGRVLDDAVILSLTGRIDATNAQSAQEDVLKILGDRKDVAVTIDADRLEYISSSGLRSILHLKTDYPDLKIINVNPEVYDILRMTGFTDIMTVERAYRKVSVEGCEEIGRGVNGTIYRIDEDNVVKVYNNPDSLEDIKHERQMAKLAMILGVPTAISYDVVKIGDCYGSMFELLNAKSFSKLLTNEPDKYDYCVKEFVALLKKLHSTRVEEGQVPDMKERALIWATFTAEYLPEEYGRKLVKLVERVPEDDHLIHGDYHTKNIEKTGEEVLLIDMDTLSAGYPVFELGPMFNAFVGYSEYDPDHIKAMQGYDLATSQRFWHDTLAAYLCTDDDGYIRFVEDKAKVIGYARMIRASIRRGGLDREDKREEIEIWKKHLIETLDRVDSLLFTPCEKVVPAKVNSLPEVQEFIEGFFDYMKVAPADAMQISVSLEEIFVNIAHYAYAPDEGDAKIRVETSQSPRKFTIVAEDSGVKFDPLIKEDPDVNLPAKERKIGGLGIFMVKKAMDDVSYEYKDGHNILRMTKFLGTGN